MIQLLLHLKLHSTVHVVTYWEMTHPLVCKVIVLTSHQKNHRHLQLWAAFTQKKPLPIRRTDFTLIYYRVESEIIFFPQLGKTLILMSPHHFLKFHFVLCLQSQFHDSPKKSKPSSLLKSYPTSFVYSTSEDDSKETHHPPEFLITSFTAMTTRVTHRLWFILNSTWLSISGPQLILKKCAALFRGPCGHYA